MRSARPFELTDNWRTCAPPTPWLLNHNGDNFCRPRLRSSHTICSLPMPCDFDQRKVVFFSALCSCQMMFHLRELEGGIPFDHLSRIDFLRATWRVIQVLPSLVEYAIKCVTLGHHHCAGSKKTWSNLPTNKLNRVCALPGESPYTLTLDIQPEKNRRRYNLLCIRLRLGKGKVLQPNNECGEGAHEFRTRFHWAESKSLEVSSANYPSRHCILYGFIQTNPLLWGRFSPMSGYASSHITNHNVPLSESKNQSKPQQEKI